MSANRNQVGFHVQALLMFVAVLLASASVDTIRASCSIRPLPLAGLVKGDGDLSLRLGDGGRDWPLGPISILKSGKPVCSVSPDVSIIQSPLMLSNSGYLYVSTYSGGSSPLFIISSKDCSVKWTGSGDFAHPRFSTTSISFDVIGADERPLKKRAIVPLDDACLPILHQR
jgi:hypothetical protein